MPPEAINNNELMELSNFTNTDSYLNLYLSLQGHRQCARKRVAL